ncbi:hypothetical protein GCM10010245_42110 [Streptomyces spectabilis]|nr:hypothetical protein GCM10010245_42110 [Streptomyces spectabilis]
MNVRNQRRARPTDSGTGYRIIPPSGSDTSLTTLAPELTSQPQGYFRANTPKVHQPELRRGVVDGEGREDDARLGQSDPKLLNGGVRVDIVWLLMRSGHEQDAREAQLEIPRVLRKVA